MKSTNRIPDSSGLFWHTGALVVAAVFVLSGCMATRNWVREQVDPLSGRVTQNENRLGQAEGQISQLGGRVNAAESKIGSVEAKLGDADAKAEKALSTLGNLKFERRLVIDMKESANFGFNSAVLPLHAKKEIDGFLSDLKGDLADGGDIVFLIAGHTDNAGSEDFNYELGKRRADSIGRYLVTQKKMDPLRVVTVSYGEHSPVTDNKTREGRAKNRRVEILVYREAINSNTSANAAPQQKASQESDDGKQVKRSY
ncbi:MAG: OmpA family protein [Deltaproteobacteria bacterium]|nr:OmpA family protein [Deltaproteobacteria bacterium]